MSSGSSSRLGGLRRFATAITLLNILGHTWLGFEQAWIVPFAAVFAAYLTELLLETLEARAAGRRARYLGGGTQWIDFLLSAHITGLAVSMLLYANERVMPVVFASVVAIASKYLVRLKVGGASRHAFNPSNLGITVTLLAFPWVGIAQPYMFTENLDGAADWILPIFIIFSGSFLNWRFTGRMPLIAAWLGGFAVQAFVRSWFFGMPLPAAWLPMTGVAFLLFSFYMVTDPATTPAGTRGQIAFGLSVAVAYCLLMSFHVVFGLFFGLTAVCTGRALWLALAPRLLAVRQAASSRPAATLQSASVVLDQVTTHRDLRP